MARKIWKFEGWLAVIYNSFMEYDLKKQQDAGT